MAGKMFETIFYCLLEFCLVTSRHYLMFRWPVQIAKLRKWQEIKIFEMQALLKKLPTIAILKKLKTILLLLEIMQ